MMVARAGDAGNTPFEDGAYTIGEKMGDQPVGGLAFRQHGTALRC